MTFAQQFLSHEVQAATIEAARATFQAARHTASEAEDWDAYDAADAEIDALSDAYMVEIQAMSALASNATADDKASLKAARNAE